MDQHKLSLKRQDSDPPAAIAQWGWRYHHLGVPTEVARVGERYLERFKMYVTGFESSPYGIEWMRFEAGSPIPEIIRRVPHLAFEVDDLEEALQGQEILTPPNAPSDGVRVAMIIHNDAPIELLQFGQVGLVWIIAAQPTPHPTPQAGLDDRVRRLKDAVAVSGARAGAGELDR